MACCGLNLHPGREPSQKGAQVRLGSFKADLLRQFDEQDRCLSTAFPIAARTNELLSVKIAEARDRLKFMRNIVDEMTKDE